MSELSQFLVRLERRALSEDQLFRYGFPRQSSVQGKARVRVHADNEWKAIPSPRKRNCERCGKLYDIDSAGWPVVRETCKWHLRKPIRGNLHPCCGTRKGVGHCQTSEYHVHCDIDPDNLTGFMNTSSGDVHDTVFALDSEMVSTTCGFEIVALSVVDHQCKVVYETMVLPEGHVLNYNTPFSGLTAADLSGVTTTMKDVHARLKGLLGPHTILVGHALHNDLMRLKLLHNKIVDTVHLYPHKRGWPAKSPLRFLKQNHLSTLHEDGLKCREDAVATMMLARLKCGLKSKP